MEGLEKRKTVKDVAAVEQKRHHRDGDKGRVGRKERNQKILSGTGVDRQAGQKRPGSGKTGIAQHHAECETDKKIAAQHGDCDRKRGAKRLFHGNHLLLRDTGERDMQ